jgi:hypothetical protein
MQVYRARLNGGRTPLTLASDLKRGGYGSGVQLAQSGPTIDSVLEGSLGGNVDSNEVVASTPVPNPPEVEHAKPEPREKAGKAARGHGKAGKGRAAAKGHAAGRHAAKGASSKSAKTKKKRS